MRKFRICMAVLTAAMFFSSCGDRPGTLRLVATSDIHGNIFPYSYYEGQEAPEGGLSRVMTYLRAQRKEYKDRLMYFDCGDNLDGSPLTYYDKTADYSGESLPAKALDDLGCLAGAFGNHDMEPGPVTYQKYFDTSKHPLVCANLIDTETGEPALPPYWTFERGGAVIAVVGFITPAISWLLPSTALQYYTVMDAVESAKSVISQIIENEHPHLIVGLLHTGYDSSRKGNYAAEDEALRIALEVPGFDVIFYGHDHQACMEEVVNCAGDSVLMICPGAYGEYVAQADVDLNVKKGELISKSVRGELVDVRGLEPDRKFTDSYKDRTDAVYHYMDSVIGQFGTPADAREAAWAPSSAVGYISSTLLRASHAQIALASAYDNSWCIEAGNVTPADMMKMYPFDNQITSLILKGSEIKSLLEYASAHCMNTVRTEADTLLKMTAKDGGYVLGYQPFDFFTAMGIDYTVDVTRPAGDRIRITGLTGTGEAFLPEKTYRVAVNSFLASGGYEPFLEGLGLTVSQLRSREDLSSGADIRFHMITSIGLAREDGRSVTPEVPQNWKLVPEELASRILERDKSLLGSR